MDREINLDSIRELEKQIEEHERAIIQLKRTRNSLLNVSTLPPEILGRIFRWNVVPEGDFAGLGRRSYNFLLVCHHWLEVASHNPELWCSWGNSIQDWARRHARCGTVPLDLVLDDWYSGHELDDKLRDALQERAARDIIRWVHLRGTDVPELLNSVVSSIVTKGDEPGLNSVESFVIQNVGRAGIVDVSAFFSRYHLPKLRRLWLHRCTISPQDLLKSQITTLTTLELTSSELSPTPSLSQLLSILSSNPFLQYLELPPYSATNTNGDGSSIRVPLLHLRKLRLSSDFCHAFQLLNQLELPDGMDSMNLSLNKCSPSDLSRTLGPYLGDRVRCQGRLPGNGLGLSSSHDSGTFHFCTFHLSTGDVRKHDNTEVDWFVSVSAVMSVQLEDEEADGLGFDLIAHIPPEQVIRLQTTFPILRSKKLRVKMHNLTYLQLEGVNLSTWFAEPDIRGPQTFKELLPRLNHIAITWPTLSGCDWSPFIDFLSRRAGVGNQISLLSLSYRPHMDKDVVESIKRAVKVFEDGVNIEDD